jgi:peptidoglycan-associated lipoprotein
MNERRLYVSKIAALLLVLALVVFASACKKKVPPPPPPPPPVVNPPTPPPPPPAARPAINNFTAEPSTIERGQASTLSWSISNATDMTISAGIGAVQSQGQRQVFPNATTTYTLTARGPGGMDMRSATVTVSTPPPPPPPPPPPSQPTLSSTEVLEKQGRDAYFDFDKSDIRPDAREALTQDSGLLKQIFGQDSGFSVIVEGHCDERGSAEYNLALGDRRATAAKDLLVQLGVAGDRMKTISYGKERPQCTEATEECWQKNRRAHLSPGQ